MDSITWRTTYPVGVGPSSPDRAASRLLWVFQAQGLPTDRRCVPPGHTTEERRVADAEPAHVRATFERQPGGDPARGEEPGHDVSVDPDDLADAQACSPPRVSTA